MSLSAKVTTHRRRHPGPDAGIHVGTSGWSYKHWTGKFYPEHLKHVDWLPFYANIFRCTEINASFYRMPKKETIVRWVKAVPEDFSFCPKMSRYLTHIKRLHDPEEPLAYFFGVFAPMKKQMGPVLIQLPPSLQFNRDTVGHFFNHATRKYKRHEFVVEGRHPTWVEPEAITLLTELNVGFVISHSKMKFPYGEFVTAKNVYLRFHGPNALFSSRYGLPTIKKYARKIDHWRREGHAVWAFFNNDVGGHAITNAKQLVSEL